MKVMLTSFGIQHSLMSTNRDNTIFHGMPPVSFRWFNQSYMPDYELLLLCDSVMMDEGSFDKLQSGAISAYSMVADTFKALKSEGRIELVDFSSTLTPHKDLLTRMVAHDIKQLDQWIGSLRESLTIWQHFSRMSMDLLNAEKKSWLNLVPLHEVPFQRGIHAPPFDPHVMQFNSVKKILDNETSSVDNLSKMVTDALGSSKKRKRKEYRTALRDVLRGYLSYVDANLILANQLGVGFHDWLDFTPFYKTKFLSVGKDGSEVEEKRAQIEKLFTVPFPDLSIHDTRSLMKALNDKRIENLRSLVAQAANGEVTFDDQFAREILWDVFKESKRVRKWRNVVGYATLPIGFIPLIGTLSQKAIEEAVGLQIKRKIEQKHRWFYMLTDITRSEKEKPNRGIESDD